MLKVTSAGTALVGNAVGVPMGLAVGAWAGQYQMLDVVGCCAEVGKGVVETEGGGLMKGGALSLSSSSSSSEFSTTPHFVVISAVYAVSPEQPSLVYRFSVTTPALKDGQCEMIVVRDILCAQSLCFFLSYHTHRVTSMRQVMHALNEANVPGVEQSKFR